MKASELMIGDWVYWSHTEDGIAPYKEAIRIELDDFSRDECIFDAHIEPIPLTPEILKKNGFEKRYAIGHLEWVLFNDSFSISIEEWLEEPSEHNYVLKYERADILEPFTQLTFSYVHELQHALRLCGIEKEIVL